MVSALFERMRAPEMWPDGFKAPIFEQIDRSIARKPIRMIRYSLKCNHAHEFEAWFRSSAAYDEQRQAGHVGCVVCGSTEVEKAVMAPALANGSKRPERVEPNLTKPGSPAEAMLAEMRRKIETTSDYVGREFAAEARKIHDGEADKRTIWGEASLEDTRSLKEDGVPVAPIPWMRRNDG